MFPISTISTISSQKGTLVFASVSSVDSITNEEVRGGSFFPPRIKNSLALFEIPRAILSGRGVTQNKERLN